MADFDWSMPLFEFFDLPTWQEISNDREIFLTSFYRKFSGHKHLKSLSSRRSRIKIGNESKIQSFWNSSKLRRKMDNSSRMSIFELKLWYSKARDSRDQLWYLIVLSVILRRLNQIQNALPMFDFCFHSKYCIQQNKLFSTQITKNMPKNNPFRKHIHRTFETFLIEKSIFTKIHSIFDGPK